MDLLYSAMPLTLYCVIQHRFNAIIWLHRVNDSIYCLCNAMLCYAMLYYAKLYLAVLYYAASYAILCHTMLCYTYCLGWAYSSAPYQSCIVVLVCFTILSTPVSTIPLYHYVSVYNMTLHVRSPMCVTHYITARVLYNTLCALCTHPYCYSCISIHTILPPSKPISLYTICIRYCLCIILYTCYRQCVFPIPLFVYYDFDSFVHDALILTYILTLVSIPYYPLKNPSHYVTI
jgi:hypothetical protein